MNESPQQAFPLKLLVLITEAEFSGKVKDFFKTRQIHLLYQCCGEGTANSEILDVLGLGGT